MGCCSTMIVTDLDTKLGYRARNFIVIDKQMFINIFVKTFVGTICEKCLNDSSSAISV